MSALLNQYLKPLRRYLDKPGLIELSINQPGEVWVEMQEGWQHRKDAALSEPLLHDFAAALATSSGQAFNASHPILATALPGYGYRVQIVSGQMVEGGFAMSIRAGTAKRFPLDGYMDSDEAARLVQAVKDRKNVIVCGGTGSGKTTFLNSLLVHVPETERVGTIEDTRELIIDSPNRFSLLKSKSGTDLGGVTYKEIINSMMRMRPDRIIMGELDIENTVPFLRLLNTGHGGSAATLHADSPDEAVDAIVLNAQLAGLKDRDAIEKYATNALDVLVHVHQNRAERKFTAVCKWQG